MNVTDPISDLLTRIRNAHLAKHDRVDVPLSKLKLQICRILEEQGFIERHGVVDSTPVKKIRIVLRYDENGVPVITRVSRVSRPGRRVYRPASEIRPVLNGLGVGIISTSKGLLTDEEAREKHVGGEVMCEIW